MRQFFPRTSRNLTMFAAGSVFAFILLCSISMLINIYASSETWDREKIEKLINAKIPTDATNLMFSGRTGIGGSLDFSFIASPNAAEGFISAVCGKDLYMGYDPFDAIDIVEPFTYAHLIQIGQSNYYSYSTGTPKTIFGNRCQPKHGGQYQIREDRSNPNTYVIRLEVKFNCSVCKFITLENIISLGDQLPIQILGIKKTGDEYLLFSDEICIGIQEPATRATTQPWQQLSTIRLNVFLDDVLIASSQTDSDGNQVDRIDGNGTSVEIEKSGNLKFYCFKVATSAGNHKLIIRSEKQNYRYSYSLSLKTQ